VRLGTYVSDARAPPAAQVAQRRIQLDPRDEPEMGERVPYVVVHDPNCARTRLVDIARRPEALIFAAEAGGVRLQLNAPYYILKRILPAMDRVFSLLGVDVGLWSLFEKRPNPSAPARTLDSSLRRVLLACPTLVALAAVGTGCR
jgi:DNA polymerase zeta